MTELWCCNNRCLVQSRRQVYTYNAQPTYELFLAMQTCITQLDNVARAVLVRREQLTLCSQHSKRARFLIEVLVYFPAN